MPALRGTLALSVALFLVTGARALAQDPASVRTVDEATVVRRALEVSHELREADARTRQASADTLSAVGDVLPDVEISARYTRLSDVPIDFRRIDLGEPGAQYELPQLLDQYALRAALVLPVTDIPFRFVPMLDAASTAERARRVEQTAVVRSVVLEARMAYFEWARAVAVAAAFDESIAALRAQLEHVRRAVVAGTLPRVDLVSLESQLASLQQQHLDALEQAELTQSALCVRLAWPECEAMTPAEETAQTIAHTTISDAIASARAMRPELTALSLDLAAIGRRRDAAMASLLPSIAMVGVLDYAAPHPRAFGRDDLTPLLSWELGAVASFSTGAAFDAAAELSRLDALQAQLEAQRDRWVAEIDESVRGVLISCRRAAERVELARENVRLAEELAVVRRAERRAGVSLEAEARQAEAALLRARREHAEATLAQRAAHARLEHATGVPADELAIARRGVVGD
ncbi:TolC family protein [Sandaracinus amylolyticus]|uniref:TolC family protein n=1 Tax=Sandaracinus amylolyticus TaxID=927083 RepID=UPI001F23BB13|nr:TolC family protein [Sandaracinus amylolyticus]UJR84173.1 Hypothetical protein I5071_62440 [Sandaracinus amylolyticus]